MRTGHTKYWNGGLEEALGSKLSFSGSFSHALIISCFNKQTNKGARLDQAETVAVITRGQVTTMMTKMPIMRYLWWQHICQWWDVYETVPAPHVVPGSTFSAWRQCKILSWKWCQCKKNYKCQLHAYDYGDAEGAEGKGAKSAAALYLDTMASLQHGFIQRRILQKTIRRSLFRGELCKMFIQRRKWHILCWEIIQMHLQTTSKVQGPFRGI